MTMETSPIRLAALFALIALKLIKVPECTTSTLKAIKPTSLSLETLAISAGIMPKAKPKALIMPSAKGREKRPFVATAMA